jgi:hypothetical protein
MVEFACNAHITSRFRHADLCCQDRQMLKLKILVRTAVYLEVVSWGDDKPQSRVCSSCVHVPCLSASACHDFRSILRLGEPGSPFLVPTSSLIVSPAQLA